MELWRYRITYFRSRRVNRFLELPVQQRTFSRAYPPPCYNLPTCSPNSMVSRGFVGSEDEILKRAQMLRRKRGAPASSSVETASLMGIESSLGKPTKKLKYGEPMDVAPLFTTSPVSQNPSILVLFKCFLTSFLTMEWTMVLCLLLPSSSLLLLRRGLTPLTQKSGVPGVWVTFFKFLSFHSWL